MSRLTKDSVVFEVKMVGESMVKIVVNSYLYFNYGIYNGKEGKEYYAEGMNGFGMDIIGRMVTWAKKNNVDSFDKVENIVGILRAIGTESVYDVDNAEFVPVSDAIAKPGEFLFGPVGINVSTQNYFTVWAKNEEEATQKILVKISNKQKTINDPELDEGARTQLKEDLKDYTLNWIYGDQKVEMVSKTREGLDLRMAEEKLGIEIPSFMTVRKSRDEKEGEQIQANTEKRRPGRPRKNPEVVNG